MSKAMQILTNCRNGGQKRAGGLSLDEAIAELEAMEAQLKAKENDLERQDMIIKCLSMDLDSKEKLLKAKDEEIKVLECRAYHAEGYISDLHNNPKDKKFYDKKARSIVAMLFWEGRRLKTGGITEKAFAARNCFYKAYALIWNP